MLALKLKENKPEHNTEAASGVNQEVYKQKGWINLQGILGGKIFFWSLSVSPMPIS